MAKKRHDVTFEHVDEKTAERGWFRHSLILIESMLWQRYAWWLACLENGTLGPIENQIPQLPFCSPMGSASDGLTFDGVEPGMIGNRAGAKSNVERTFKRCFDNGSHLHELIDWWLWAFGDGSIEKRPAIAERSAIIMYTELELHRLIAHPADWMAHIAGEYISKMAKQRSGWFATPMDLCVLIAQMTLGTHDGDTRRLTLNEPCVGTGPILLASSNYVIDMSANDIDALMVSACKFNCYLYVPWMVCGDKMRLIEFKVDAMKKILQGVASVEDYSEPEEAPVDEQKPLQLSLF